MVQHDTTEKDTFYCTVNSTVYSSDVPDGYCPMRNSEEMTTGKMHSTLLNGQPIMGCLCLQSRLWTVQTEPRLTTLDAHVKQISNIWRVTNIQILSPTSLQPI